MEIYLDMVIIINFILDFYILYGVKKILKRDIRIKKIIRGSLVGSISIILLFIKINNIILILSKFIISCLIILSCFGRREFLKNLEYFYLISIILGGSFYLLDIGVIYQDKGIIINNNYLLNISILIILGPIIIYLFVKDNLEYKNIYSNKYIVDIYINKKKYTTEAILDTGNRLIDNYKKRSVVLVNLDIKRPDKCIYVPYKALNTNGVIPCIEPDKIIINKKVFKNCLVGLCREKFDLGGARCILPNKFKEDL